MFACVGRGANLGWLVTRVCARLVALHQDCYPKCVPPDVVSVVFCSVSFCWDLFISGTCMPTGRLLALLSQLKATLQYCKAVLALLSHSCVCSVRQLLNCCCICLHPSACNACLKFMVCPVVKLTWYTGMFFELLLHSC